MLVAWHQNLETIRHLIIQLQDTGRPEQAFALGYLSATAEENHVILDDDVLEQIAGANDLNDATGYFAIWLGKRVEAAGGKVTDF